MIYFYLSLILSYVCMLDVTFGHGVLYYRPSQHACDFCIWAWEAFDVLNILNMVILGNEIICEDLMKIT